MKVEEYKWNEQHQSFLYRERPNKGEDALIDKVKMQNIVITQSLDVYKYMFDDDGMYWVFLGNAIKS